MDLKKIIKEEVYNLISEIADIEAKAIVQKVSEEIDINGIEIISDELDWDKNEIYIDLSSQKTQYSYSIGLTIDYTITKEAFYSSGRWGSSVDTSEAPYGEPAEWEMKLIKGEIWEEGTKKYEGKEIFEELFKKCYNFIYSHFNDSIQEGKPHTELEEFIQEEILKLHNKFLLESEKEMVEKQLNLLKEYVELTGDEDSQPGDVEYHRQDRAKLRGIGNFKDVDWKILHDELIENTKNNEKYAPGTFSSLYISKNDITDNEISREEYTMLEDGGLFETFDFYPIIVHREFFDFNSFYKKAEEIWNNHPAEKQYTEYDSEKPYLRGREPMSELKTASGNPLDGRSKQSAINYIYKIFKQIDHGQRYKDTAWENVHKIFNLFGNYEIDTSGGYDAEYNPGGVNVGEMTPQWKKWYCDFNFKDNKGIDRIITFILTAHAGGTVQDPWSSYDITFYPVDYKRKEK